MISKKGLLIVISGPSGTGKGTVCKSLVEKNNFWVSVSSTTRSPREGEVHGKNYYFLTKEEFENKINENGFLEYAKVYDNYYGTPKDKVLNLLDKGEDVILEIDVQGALNVKKAYGEAVLIFIVPPSMKELRNRIIKRGSETEESLNKRFNSAYEEMSYANEYNYIVENNQLKLAVNKIECIITSEKCKINRTKQIIFDKEEGLINEQFND